MYIIVKRWIIKLMVKEIKNKDKLVQNFIYMFKTYLLAALLMAFWAIPFVMNMEYTTPYADFWDVSFSEVFPTPINIFLGLSILVVILGAIWREERIIYLGFCILIAVGFYFIAAKIHLVNIRFAPFFQYLVMVTPVSVFGLKFFKKINKKYSKIKWIIPLIVFFAVAWFLQKNVSYIPHWIKWNYEGFEEKAKWPDYRDINEYLEGDYKDPRVVYEHSGSHNQYGTSRAFESLPLFSGRSTLEGLFMQSSISSPFVFYIQSEISKEHSCPFWRTFDCTQRDLDLGTKHLEMYNVKDFIVVSDEVKEDLRNRTEYKLVEEAGDLRVYELTTNEDRYIVVPDYEPVVFSGKDWKNFFYDWFKEEEYLEVPIIYTKNSLGGYKEITNLEEIEKVPLNYNCTIKEEIHRERIEFQTNCVGVPHIVKISYHPSWKVEGADEVHLASPSFMLVIPEQENVVLRFRTGKWQWVGKILTFMGLGFLGFNIVKNTFFNKKRH